MSAQPEWGAIALLGALHGVNPAMGWLFAVSLGLQARSSRAVWSALAPLALGHALAVAAALATGAILGIVLPLTWIRWIAAAALLAFGVQHLRSHSHPRWGVGGMCVGPRQLTTWSFLVSSAHGAGLMVLPFVMRPTSSADAHTDHVSGHGAHLAGVVVSTDHNVALLATLLHTAGYLAVAGAIAWIAYRWLGLRFLRRAWINMNVIWAAALLLTAVATAAHGQGRKREGAWGFVNARYDSRASGSVYTGYGWRHGFAMGGLLHNARSGDVEMLGGVGAAFKTSAGSHHSLAIATAQSSTIASAQVFWLSTVRTGVVTTRAQVNGTDPYKGSAAQKLGVSPVSMTFAVRRRLAVGAALDMSAAERATTSISMGLQVRLRLPGAGVRLDALRDVRGSGSRLRMFSGSVF